MKVRNLKSACVSVETNNVKILMDPWLVDGEYYGSWYHYPKLEYDKEFFDSFDYIYVSHIHPDHFSKKTFEILNKEIPVLIHKFSSPFLKMNIERLGFNVVELAHNKKTELKNGVSIDILSADNCNPELCMKFMGCSHVETKFKMTQIDSLCVISNGKFNLLNLNDCPYDLAKEAVKEVNKKYNKIDFLLVGYAGAGPYPQCFELSDKERENAEQSKKIQFLNQAEKYIDLVKPDFYMPFAGTYTLSGFLSNLQYKRGVPELEEALKFFKKSKLINQKKSKSVALNTYEYFDLELKKSSNEYIPFDENKKIKYIKNILSKKKFDYEYDSEVDLDDMYKLIPNAYNRMESKRKEINFKSETKVLIKLKKEKLLKISFDGSGFEYVSEIEKNNLKSFVQYDLSDKLLLRILKGPRFAHWNNAEVGSHIRFTRVPNKFERGLYHTMCFFHS
jgi:UDP-MurNAc hydroxylase